MIKDNKIWVAESNNHEPIYILPEMINRHGLIAGATGTGKTTTLKVVVEGLSNLGIPTFLADIKGDVASLARKGEDNENVYKRVQDFSIEDFSFESFPVELWDIYGEMGLPVRTTVSEMGPLLLAKLLELNDVQTSVLSVIFKIADERGLLLIDVKDLKSMLQYIYDNAKDYEAEYGKLSTASVSSIMRSIVFLEEQGGNLFFGEPALDISDWIKTDSEGHGVVNVLHGVKLFQNPTLYATFLLWMLSELFEQLPEVGDSSKPKMVFFFDEAHLLFNDMPKTLINKIEQVIKLIRSKGVGIFFITQAPSDIPDSVLNQLGNKIQHALRAYTPAEQKVIKAAAQSFRVNETFDTGQALTELGIGEALVSCLDIDGKPSIVERAFILPPQSYMGTLDESTRNRIINHSLLYSKYAEMIDRESAYELLSKQKEDLLLRKQEEEQRILDQKQAQIDEKEAIKLAKQKEKEEKAAAKTAAASKSSSTKMFEKGLSSTVTAIGREVGRTLIRGVLGSLK